MRVDLPEPDVPTIATNSPRSMRKRNVVQRADGLAAGPPVRPADARKLDHVSLLPRRTGRIRELADEHLVALAEPGH